jgi:hypothetical protein
MKLVYLLADQVSSYVQTTEKSVERPKPKDYYDAEYIGSKLRFRRLVVQKQFRPMAAYSCGEAIQ